MPSTQRTPLIADDDPTLRKVRRSILPVVFLLYTFNYMDRASISYAQLTMSEDLGIDLATYGAVAAIFFVAYVLGCGFANVLAIVPGITVSIWPPGGVFMATLILTSPYRRFGGLSSLRLDPKGERFIAASDKGTWFTGRIVYRDREMTGLADVEAAPMLAADGRTLAAHNWFDTESMALDGGTIYVGIERVNRIVRFDFGRDGVRARGEDIAVPPAVRKLPYNRGLEAMVVAILVIELIHLFAWR